MATVAHVPSRSLLGKFATVLGDGTARRLAERAAAAVREHLPTVAGLGAMTFGAFQAAAAAGWIVAGVSLLVLEWKVRD